MRSRAKPPSSVDDPRYHYVRYATALELLGDHTVDDRSLVELDLAESLAITVVRLERAAHSHVAVERQRPNDVEVMADAVAEDRDEVRDVIPMDREQQLVVDRHHEPRQALVIVVEADQLHPCALLSLRELVDEPHTFDLDCLANVEDRPLGERSTGTLHDAVHELVLGSRRDAGPAPQPSSARHPSRSWPDRGGVLASK